MTDRKRSLPEDEVRYLDKNACFIPGEERQWYESSLRTCPLSASECNCTQHTLRYVMRRLFSTREDAGIRYER